MLNWWNSKTKMERVYWDTSQIWAIRLSVLLHIFILFALLTSVTIKLKNMQFLIRLKICQFRHFCWYSFLMFQALLHKFIFSFPIWLITSFSWNFLLLDIYCSYCIPNILPQCLFARRQRLGCCSSLWYLHSTIDINTYKETCTLARFFCYTNKHEL